MFNLGDYFEPEFKDLILNCATPLKKLNGISNINPFELADSYLDVDNIADLSIDPNANISGKSPVNFKSEIFKPILKMRSFYLLWKEVKEWKGLDFANECISSCLTGKLYVHDLTKFDEPYCFATDSSHWMIEGRPYGWLPGGQPKKLQSFIGQTVEVAMDLSQEHAGAIGLSNVLVNCAYYSYNDRIQLKRSINHLDRLIPFDVPNRTEEITNIIVGFFAHNDEDFQKKKRDIALFNPKHPTYFIDIAMFLYDKIVEDLLQHFVHVMHNTFRVGGDSIAEFTKIMIKKEDEVFYKPIGEFIKEQGLGAIEPGNETLSFNVNTGKVEWKPIYATIRHENPNKFVKIKLKTGQEIDVTDNHSMFTIRKDGLIDLVAPRSNPSNLVVPRKFNFSDEASYTTLSIVGSHGTKELPEEFIFDEKFARFLGHYVANGNISNGSLELSLFNSDLEKYTKKTLKKILPSVSFNTHVKGKLKCNVGVDFGEMIAFLCGKGAGSKHIPHYILDASNDVIKAFLSGYFECDGWVDSNRICASTISDDLQKGIGLLLLKLGIVYSMRHKITEEHIEYKAVNDDYVTVRPDTVISVSGQYKDYFSFIRTDKEEKRKKITCTNPHNYCDFNYLRPMIKNVYRDTVKLKSDGALEITLTIVDELYADLKERIKYADLNVTSLEELKDLADTLMMPYNAFKHYENEFGWQSYSLREPVTVRTLERFKYSASIQLASIKSLYTRLSILQNVVPIKVDTIEYLPDEKYSYDISVEDNENFLAGDNLFAHNSPFTNLSLFCRETIKNVFAEAIYPDWTTPLDIIEEIMHIQELFLRFFAKGSPITEKSYRFPVTTANFATKSREPLPNEEYDPEKHFTEEEKTLYPDKKYLIKDKEFFKTVTKYNAERGVVNFHRGDKIANCCLTATTKLLAKVDGAVRYVNAFQLYDTVNNGFREVEIMGENNFIPVTNALKIPYKDDILKIILDNGLEINVTKNHPSVKVLQGEILEELEAQYLKEGDLIPLAKYADYDTSIGNFNLGKFVGLYVAEGSINSDRTDAIIFSINKDRTDLQEFLRKFGEGTLGAEVSILPHKTDNVVKVYVKSPSAFGLVKNFVHGNTAKEKYLSSKAFNTSKDFRLGLLEGVISGDGYTADASRSDFGTLKMGSKQLIQDLIAICNTIGIKTFYHAHSYHHNPRNKSQVTYSYVMSIGSEFKKLIPCLTNSKDVIKKTKYQIRDRGDFYAVPIKEIKTVPAQKGEIFVYDFEVNSKTHLFQIGNGIITHNCRLTQSLKDLREKFRADAFGNGGMSLGSARIVALNEHGIACEAKLLNEEFTTLMNKYQYYAEVLLVVHRNWLKKIISTGFLKFFNINWENMNMYFSTFGFTGMWDAFNVLSADCSVQPSYEAFAKETINLLESNAQIANERYSDVAFNVEEIPAENASPKLAQMDNFIYKKYSWYEEVPLLSNQLIPLYEEFDVFDRMEIMGNLMDDVSGGTIAHFNVDGSMTEEASYRITELLIEKYGLVHFALEIGSSTCVNGHTHTGIHQKCPECNADIKTWTRRVVGYNSDTENWAEVRREWENARRQVYKLKGDDYAN